MDFFQIETAYPKDLKRVFTAYLRKIFQFQIQETTLFQFLTIVDPPRYSERECIEWLDILCAAKSAPLTVLYRPGT